MSSVNLSRFQFSGGENAAPIENLAALPREDQERLVLAGIDVNDSTASGAFMQLNHAGVHCETRHEGLDLMDIRTALKKFDGLPPTPVTSSNTSMPTGGRSCIRASCAARRGPAKFWITSLPMAIRNVCAASPATCLAKLRRRPLNEFCQSFPLSVQRRRKRRTH